MSSPSFMHSILVLKMQPRGPAPAQPTMNNYILYQQSPQLTLQISTDNPDPYARPRRRLLYCSTSSTSLSQLIITVDTGICRKLNSSLVNRLRAHLTPPNRPLSTTPPTPRSAPRLPLHLQPTVLTHRNLPLHHPLPRLLTWGWRQRSSLANSLPRFAPSPVPMHSIHSTRL